MVAATGSEFGTAKASIFPSISKGEEIHSAGGSGRKKEDSEERDQPPRPRGFLDRLSNLQNTKELGS
jgi:hypothetical protein